MRSRELRLALVSLLLAGGGIFATAGPAASGTEGGGYAVLKSDLEPFRSDFNAKSDHVRAVLLVSPT